MSKRQHQQQQQQINKHTPQNNKHRLLKQELSMHINEFQCFQNPHLKTSTHRKPIGQSKRPQHAKNVSLFGGVYHILKRGTSGRELYHL